MTAAKQGGVGPAHRRVLFASLVGTAVEFYDFYIYATAAALVFGPLFFPSESASAQLFAAYASFGLAFVARPLGASVFGHFGDRIGRKSTLVASLLLLGGSTLANAFLPTYQMIGRSDESRVGTECVSQCRSLWAWSLYHKKTWNVATINEDAP